MIQDILAEYGISPNCIIEPLTSGLINQTFKITDGSRLFILQRINEHVFKNPYDLSANVHMMDEFLKMQSPDYLFVSPIVSLNKEALVYEKTSGYFRLFPFIKGSHTIDVVSTPQQAYEAASQFGKFTHFLANFDVTRLHATIPDFHNLALRYVQFEKALKDGNKERIKQCLPLISDVKTNASILYDFQTLQRQPDVKQRVTHHDTKISNVLFDEHERGLCVIDLDTVMPGYFISDVGDMMRTYLSPANEETSDFKKIEVRDDFFQAIVHGYLSVMGDDLSSAEKELIFYSGLFLTYMQAIRFLTDYLNNDTYYGARYPEQNFVRAGNQLTLLKRMLEKEKVLKEVIKKEL
jgi:Ser/Thr protein kinase RdoA (MazF antagonist)